MRRLRERLPLAPNLSQPEFVPTSMMALFDVLRECFPAHRLLMSDFHALPDAVEGVNAPVVQTRYRRTSIPVSTPFVGFPFSLLPKENKKQKSDKSGWGLMTRVGPARVV